MNTLAKIQLLTIAIISLASTPIFADVVVYQSSYSDPINTLIPGNPRVQPNPTGPSSSALIVSPSSSLRSVPSADEYGPERDSETYMVSSPTIVTTVPTEPYSTSAHSPNNIFSQ